MTYTEREKRAMAVAVLTKRAIPQSEIKTMLNLPSQSEVSRLMKEAKEREWITWELQLPDDVDGDEIARMGFGQYEELNGKLRDLWRDNGGVPVCNVTVLYAGPEGATQQKRLTEFGRQASDQVLKLLRNERIKSCAVAWGRTINAMTDALPPQRPSRPDLVFVPISGEPFKATDASVSPSAAARRMAEAFGSTDQCLSLAGVAARIPSDLGHHSETIRSYVSRWPDYDEIFGGGNPLMGQVDMIITGIGDIATSQDDPLFQETEKAEGGTDLSKIAAGNIGGVWIPKDSTDPEQVEQIRQINDRGLGIQKEQFIACADRGSKGQVPGVIVLAVRPEKATIVARAIGMVNHLIIGQPLAEALLEV